ncbi:MAG: hypothetical protein WC798_01745 [Candidatus Paceibacterota bacterium]|jgi:hypothetical protein
MDTEETKLKKYIRTFAGDIEAVQKGSTPDLVPLAESRPPSLETPPLPPPPPPTTSEPSLVPTPIPVSNVGHVSISPLSIPIAKVEPPSSKPDVSPLETYAGDFADRMESTNASSATVLAAEQDAAPKVPQPVQKSSHGILYVCAGIALLVVGGWGMYAAYTRDLDIAPSALLEPDVSPIFVDERERISGTGSVLLRAIEQSASRPLAPGAVRLLSLADTVDTSIFSALQFPAPDKLLRNVDDAGSIAGVLDIGDKQNPFFILAVVSYGETFSGMLSWEPVMPRDLAQLFPLYSVASTTATTTTAGFRDEAVQNHDIRVYRDATGRSIIAYGYRDQRTLVIARDPAAWGEIADRLASSRTR